MKKKCLCHPLCEKNSEILRFEMFAPSTRHGFALGDKMQIDGANTRKKKK